MKVCVDYLSLHYWELGSMHFPRTILILISLMRCVTCSKETLSGLFALKRLIPEWTHA